MGENTDFYRNLDRNLFIGLLCVILFAAGYCKRTDDRVSRDPSTVVYQVISEKSIRLQYSYSYEFALVFPPLFRWDENAEEVGHLVKSWEYSSDYLTWTYHLRKDIRWHDGVPFTAHDIKFSDYHKKIRREIRPEAYTLNVIDDYTFSINFNEKQFYNPCNVYIRYLPKHLLEGQDPEKYFEWNFWDHPVGYGPYRFVRHVPNTLLELEANPDYFLGKPKIERVILKFGGNPVTELLSGNADIILSWEGKTDFMRLAEDPRFNRYSAVGQQISTIYWNHNHYLFSDYKVRRALTLALDRHELYRLHHIPDEFPVVDGLINHRQLLAGEIPEPIPHDPEQARQLLEEAGWVDRDGDGVRDRDGKKFNFTLLTNAERSSPAVLLQEYLRRVGVQMEIQTMDVDVLWKRVESGEFYEAVYLMLTEEKLHGIAGIGYDGRSLIGYSNPELLRIFKEAENDWEPGWRERLNLKIYRLFQADVPVTVLQPHLWTTIAHRRIKGFSSPTQTWPGLFMDLLWIEEEK
jgi:peptide/nickel transport system substrate-binding protein